MPDPDLRKITLIGGDEPMRLIERARFLAGAGWGGAYVRPLAGDASARRYFRVIRPDGSAVLMDDPLGDVPRFVAVTQWLLGRRFGAPQIYAQDQKAGLLLLEDFGDDLVVNILAQSPARTTAVYERIVDVLVDLHRHPPPDFVAPLDGPLMAEQVGLFAEWYPQAAGVSGDFASAIAPTFARLHAELAALTLPVMCLRDFHSPNLIWRGDAPLGLIDYQDAVACHPAYDLVSALQDARRDVPPEVEAAGVARYLAATGADEASFRAAYALIGAQRNLRIMGVFVRLCIRDGKPRYLDFIPRIWGCISRNLDHPALAPLAEIVNELPAPKAETLERIRRQCFRP